MQKGYEKFEPSEDTFALLQKNLNKIKKQYHTFKISDYTKESVIHEFAFRNHFDNGVLSYIEQDLERLRSVFMHFDEIIIKDFGFSINFLIEIYKEIELISIIKYNKAIDFSYNQEFLEYIKFKPTNEAESIKSVDQLSEDIQKAFIAFQNKPYIELLLKKEELYDRFPSKLVDLFFETFAIKPNSDVVFRYYAACNPIEDLPILKLKDNGYLSLYSKQLPIAIYNRLYNHLLRNEHTNEKIRRHRDQVLEKKVVEIFRSFFPSKDAFFYENYFVQNNNEQDLLIIYKGTALIIEVKASRLREPFRDINKAIKRITDDFKGSIQYGFNQCQRVEEFFLDNIPFSIKNSKGRNLYTANPNRIHSIHSIVVTLERFGSLQTDLGLMLEKDDDTDYPWSVYINDLEIFLLTLKQNTKNAVSKFLTFLKQRKKLHGRVYATDELDICSSYFLDPDEFRDYSEANEFIIFPPDKQSIFDKLYYAKKLKFKEKKLPEEYYKYGIDF